MIDGYNKSSQFASSFHFVTKTDAGPDDVTSDVVDAAWAVLPTSTGATYTFRTQDGATDYFTVRVPANGVVFLPSFTVTPDLEVWVQ